MTGTCIFYTGVFRKAAQSLVRLWVLILGGDYMVLIFELNTTVLVFLPVALHVKTLYHTDTLYHTEFEYYLYNIIPY